ncbi:MAG TPA: hypothetical protein VLV49_06160 [Terriglobales bacterium]|nr:hypothetical protein [Terriglobales bacterium]
MSLIRLQLAAIAILAAASAFGQAVPSDPAIPPSPHLSAQAAQYTPITGKQRWNWFVRSTIGPQSLAAGLLSAGLGTATDSPPEYRGTWAGFGKRYGMRLTGVSTGNAMEAGLGAIWGEDPRYFRDQGAPFGHRVLNIIKLTFAARRPDGDFSPAYARYIATAGNNFLSNTWRVSSEADSQHAVERTLLGFVGRMGSNAFQEFWPDVRQHLFKKNH